MKFIILGAPISNARHRCRCIGRNPSAYDSQSKLRQAEKRNLSMQIDLIANTHAAELEALSKGPLRLTLGIYMPLNDSDSKATRNAKLWGLIMPDTKPDFDNLTKWVCDLANGILWTDDAQIVEAHIFEKYSECPCTTIEIESIKMSMNDNAKAITKLFSPEELDIMASRVTLLSGFLDLNMEEHGKEYSLNCIADQLISFANLYGQRLNKLRQKEGT